MMETPPTPHAAPLAARRKACVRWRGSLATLLLLVAAPFSLPLAASAAPPRAGIPNVYLFTEPSQALVFDGQGWGHGVGLCQWGARGRALAGQTSEQIIAAYYRGTEVQQAIAPETTIRVLLDTGRPLHPGESPRVTARDGPWQVETAGVPPVEAPPGGYLELSGDGADGEGPGYSVHAPDGATLADGPLRNPLVLRPLEATTRFTVGYKPAAEVPGRPGNYYDTYRGELILSPRGDGLETVNRLALQDYLKGVVPAEMPASWPVEALKAQVLAARSYAVAQARNRAGERYDVDDTTRYQVYLGVNVERPNVNQLVDATAGQAIVHGGQVIQGFFFSTCAGWTENNEAVWSGAPLPYLRGIQDVDPAGRPYDAGAPRSAWTTGALTAAQLEGLLNADPATAVGRLLSLDLSQRAPSGRLVHVRATGSNGTKAIRPDTLMTHFNRLRPPGVAQLLSTNFDLRWTTAEAVAETQGAVPTPQSVQSTPAPAEVPRPPPAPVPAAPTAVPMPAPAPVPTPAYYLAATEPAPPRPDGPTSRYVPETGHNIGGAFLRFYDEWGGLDLFGYPRTEEIMEDGRTVQYFQRARFEYHPDKGGTPYEVQLTLLGDQVTAGRRPFPTVDPFLNSDQQVYFPETGHSLSFGFLSYWRDRGGLDVFGYPISEEMTEDGYTVQYFQRARFEYHPELPEPYQVSLGLLGDQLLTQRLWLK